MWLFVCFREKKREMGEGEGTLQSIYKSVHGQTEIIELTSFHFRSCNFFSSVHSLFPYSTHPLEDKQRFIFIKHIDHSCNFIQTKRSDSIKITQFLHKSWWFWMSKTPVTQVSGTALWLFMKLIKQSHTIIHPSF